MQLFYTLMLVSCQTAYPQVTHALPAAVAIGSRSEVEIFASPGNLGNTRQVVFQGEGLSAEVLPTDPKVKPKPGTVRLKVTVDAKAAPGPREFRMVTSEGVSTVGQLLVVDAPVQLESPGVHGTPDKAHPLKVGNVVCGQVAVREEVDVFHHVDVLGGVDLHGLQERREVAA